MPTLKEQILLDVTEMSTDLGDPVFTWQGCDYICVPGTANDSKEVDIGGFTIGTDLVISVKTDLFTNNVYPEAQKSKIIYSGKTYRVIRVGFMNHGATIRLWCVSEFRMK